MANRKNGAIYVGSASDLPLRIGDHKQGVGSVFTRKYGCHTLVWYQRFESMSAAAQMERRIKRWKRQWKIELIEERNKHWLDLSGELL
ncbi:GIY-YIG nuclease family protein [Hyphomonas sp. FCG-A18]|jgi:putative endonuclease|uniref:GIY-YIG nuclease family protein n=1 Tax=Hyphomonas sp. FCG-A18 TaxID=3080019 RepID=UPI002B2F6B52|nr:GIY-YIG nuclease family protein [Hyphomonas sp. FCG-A18]